MIAAYEVSEVCAPDTNLGECEHFAEHGGYTVLFETGSGMNFRQKTEHLCAACLPSDARVFETPGGRVEFRHLSAKEETRVKTPSRRPSNRW